MSITDGNEMTRRRPLVDSHKMRSVESVAHGRIDTAGGRACDRLAAIVVRPSRSALMMSGVSPISRSFLLLTALVTGAVVMALEILGSRLLAPVFGNSLFVWGALIGVIL